MGDRREFPNPFPPFHGENLLSPQGKIAEEFSVKLEDCIQSLLSKLDYGLKSQDKNDFTVYTGVTGIALLHFHLYNAGPSRGDSKHLRDAAEILERPLRHLKEHRFTFLCGDAGPLAIGAVVYSKLGKEGRSEECIRKLCDMLPQVIQDESLPDEILYGRAGYVYALLFVRHYLGDALDGKLILQVCQKMLKSGQQTAHRERSKCPLMYEWHEKKYFGAAHGLSGIFFMLMQIGDPSLNSQLEQFVLPSIDYMLQLQFPSGNCPSSMGSNTDKLVHWCHGAPGWIHMFAMAYKKFGKEKYLQAATKCAEVIWQKGLLWKGYGICHGTAGNAYAFLTMYKLTGNQTYLYQACKFAEWCFDYGRHGCRIADRPFSLFEGMAGTIYFLVDMMDPSKAKFPAFEL
ncbi:2 [Octopus vulgaris]|uniref:2 n=2 Tax=Octopus TaxID=6643 RepID=A0AA36AGA9_OCTVU|nr:lanC-like protein 2 [Octopus sinensis]CAI9715591.1 2 [Octopus vulgaris] [Octopus vulgaris]